MRASERPAPPRTLVGAAFLAVYLVWGSTYLAIGFVVETMPPFLSAGARFLFSGAVLYAVCRGRGAAAPSPAQWRSTAIIGTLLLLGGNGLVAWAQQWVPSGLAALLVASVPLYLAIMASVFERRQRPRARGIAGLLLGFLGVGILVEPGSGATAEPSVFLGAVAVLLASLLWASGSFYSRRAELPESPFLSTAMQMTAGGAALTLAGAIGGEFGRLDPAAITLKSWLSLAYLIAFGSFVAFTAYVWILQVSTPAKVGTYAYVNPMIAVFLGWWLGAETVGPRTLLAAAAIIAAVAMITSERSRAAEPEPGPEDAPSPPAPVPDPRSAG